MPTELDRLKEAFALFELSHLRCFVAVAEELHFGRAAARLNMTQPPLSRQIQVLERILNVTLIDRTSRSVRLTPAGQTLLPEAQRLIRAAVEAADRTQRVSAGQLGLLRVGFTAASAYSVLPSLIRSCTDNLPGIALSLNEMVTSSQIEALLSRALDLAFLRPPVPREEFESVRVWIESLLVCIPEEHDLARRNAVTVHELDGEPFIMYQPQAARYFHDLLVSTFSASKVLPRYVQYLTQIHSILALVQAGIGVAVVPESAANLRYKGVVMLPLSVEPPNEIELYAAWRRDDRDPALQKLMRLLADLQSNSRSGSAA